MKKYFSNKFVKISCLNSFMNVINDTVEKPNKLIVHTANGIYIGTLKVYDDSENYEVKDNDDILTTYHKLYLKTIDNIEIDKDNKVERVLENPISITLENVEIFSSNVRTNLPFVEIFIDQIIGISLGSISDN